MAKIYTNLFAAGALILSCNIAANAEFNSAPVAITAEDGEDTTPQKPYGPEIDLKFLIIGNEGDVQVDIKAPTDLMGDWYTGTSDTPITGTMTIKLVKSCEVLEVENKVVAEWEDVNPGEEISFTDKDVEVGMSWNYRAIAIVDGMESEPWYGALGIYTGVRPLSVKNFAATADKGQAPVTLSLMVPDGLRNAEEYPDLKYVPTRVYVTRKFRALDTYEDVDEGMIWEQENPDFDTLYEFIDDNKSNPMPEGTYTYNAIVQWQWGESSEESQSVGLFQDAPATPENIVATPVEEGVLITWDAVTTPSGVGYLDPESVVYNIYRYFSYDNKVLIGENVKENKYIDDLDGIDTQMLMTYQIIAKNDSGSSNEWYGYSTPIIVGPACQLPFIETFGTKGDWSVGADMLWTSKTYSGYANWYVYTSASYYADGAYESIMPSDPSKALVYTTFASYQPDGDIAYVSGDIDFVGHDNGTVTFRYYGHPKGKVNLSVEIVRYDAPEGEEISELDEAPFETAWSGSIKADEEGWIEVEAPFEGFASSDKINLRLRAVSDMTEDDTVFIPAAVEYIKVEANDDNSMIESVSSAEIISVEYYDMQGMRLAAPVKGQPIIRKSVMSNGSVRTSKVILK